MERLTEKDQYSQGYKIQAKNLNSHCVAKDAKGYITYYGQHIDKLAEYENLEEQGRLIKLPCKVGDTVYHVVQGRIVEVSNVDLFFLLLSVAENRFNNSVFLTKSEAEQKLKEMESD